LIKKAVRKFKKMRFRGAFCWNNWFGGQRRLQDGRRVAWVYS